MTENKIKNETQETQVTPKQNVVINCIEAINNIRGVLHSIYQQTNVLLQINDSAVNDDTSVDVNDLMEATNVFHYTAKECVVKDKLLTTKMMFELRSQKFDIQDKRSIELVNGVIGRCEAFIKDEVLKYVGNALNLFDADTFDDNAYYEQIKEIESNAQCENVYASEAMKEIICMYVKE